MYMKGTTVRGRRSWRLLLGVLYIGLVILGGTLSVTHSHSEGGAVHADCSLCVTAHIAVQLVAAYLVVDVARVYTAVHVSPASAPSQDISPFALFTRPPPVDFVLA